MKNYGILVLIAVVLGFLSACKEVGPDINLHGNEHAVSDTTYVESPVQTAEPKNVLIEEMTGVRCTNCPQAHQLIADLKTQYPGRIVAVAMHPINSLGGQYPFSTDTLKNQKSQILFDYLGQIGSEPAAAIDRVKFSGESHVLLDKPKWSGYVASEIVQITPVNMQLSKTFDSVTRKLTVTVELHYLTGDTAPNKLTVTINESGIVTPQLDGTIIDTFYTHNDVMRDVITDTDGDLVGNTHQAGTVVIKVFQTTLDPAWKPRNMSITAYVHEYKDSKRVYQAKEIKVE